VRTSVVFICISVIVTKDDTNNNNDDEMLSVLKYVFAMSRCSPVDIYKKKKIR
jgi:hypothetical protein